MTRSALSLLVATAVLALYWREGERVLEANGPTFDEGVHLAAGHAYWTTGRFRLNAEHPPLLKLWWAAPLQLSGNTPALREAVADPNGDQWLVAKRFLYDSGTPHDDLLRPARRMNLVLGCGIVLLAGWWSYRVWNHRLAGLVALGFAATDPNLLAHACVLTTDCGLAFFSLLTCWRLWEYVGNPSRGRLVAAGVSLGFLLGSKFSSVAMVAAIGAAGVFHLACGGVLALPGRSGRWKAAFDFAFRLGLIALLALAATYGFAEFNEWGRGLKFQLTRGQNGDSRLFLLGDHSSTGWYHYFVVAVGVKLPLGLLAGSVLGALLVAFSRGEPRRLAFLLVPPLLFFIAMSYSRVNLGVRVVLPSTVFLYILAARGIASCCVWNGTTIASLAFSFAAMRASLPFPLAYFNAIAPPHALADSNRDWGQGLPALSEYMREENLDAVYLSYFGTDRPEAYGIRYQSLPGSGRIGPPGGEPIPANAPRHAVAISVNNLLGIYLANRDEYDFLRGRQPDRVLAGSLFIFDLSKNEAALIRIRSR